MARNFDVFLCGGGDDVKHLWHYVRRDLMRPPSTAGCGPIGVFRDESDLGDTGPAQNTLRAAILQASIGAHRQPAALQKVEIKPLEIACLLRPRLSTV